MLIAGCTALEREHREGDRHGFHFRIHPFNARPRRESITQEDRQGNSDLMSDEDPHTRSDVLRSEFGASWRVWAWIQRQFTPTSLAAIGAILAASGGYIVHLRESVVQVRERVVVLETKVIPFVEGETRIATLETVLNDHGARITRLESNWDEAKTAAGTPPPPTRRRK